MKRTFLAILGIIAIVLVACGGGGGSSVGQPATNTASKGSNGTGTATFTIRIPSATLTSSAKRHPAYVSAGTESVAFTVSSSGGSPSTTVVAVTPGSPGCSGMGSTLTCTESANVPAGPSETITIATYGNSTGTGTPLSVNSVTQAITAGQANPISVTLNGVLNSVALNLSASAFAIGTSSSIGVTVVPYDAAGDQIIGPGTLVDASGNAVTASLSDSDTTGATSIASGGSVSSGYTLNYTGAQIPSPTLTLSGSSFTTVTKLVRVDSAVVDGDFSVAASANNSLGAPWYTCIVNHTALTAEVNPQPTPRPSPTPTQGSVATPYPSAQTTPIAQLEPASTLPSGVANSVSGAYAHNAMIEAAPLPSSSPYSFPGAVGICQDITIPSGTPALHLQILEGGDDNFGNSDAEATLYNTPSGSPHSDGTTISTARVATLFAENNCWDAAAWEPIFLGSGYGGTGTGSSISATSRFATCPETPGGTPPYPSDGTSLGGYWYSRTLTIPVGEVGGSYTLFLGMYRHAGSGTPALASNAYYSFSFFTGVGIY